MNSYIPMTNISFAGLFIATFSGTFALLGLIFLGVGLGVMAAQNKRSNRCTAFAEGTVSAYQSQFGASGLRAVYSFSIDGKPMQYVSNYTGTTNLLIGQTVNVYYDPQEIGCVYIEEDVRQMRRFMRVFAILGGVFLFVALAAALVTLALS